MNITSKISMYSIVVILLVFGAISAVPTVNFKDPNYAVGHDVMVHLFEWKWKDIADECERFLGPMGYGGIQVSPVQENVIVPSRPWWERYQPISYQWITRSGNEEDFKDMVRRCNAVGVRIYVDVILNHMAADQSFEVIGTGNSTADPPSRNYPAIPYIQTHFNEPCDIRDWSDPVQIRNCELVGLHDLNQSIEYVREKAVKFLNDLIHAGVAGFRIDAAKHMWPQDLHVIYSRLHDLNTEYGFRKGSRPYIYQEVIDMGGEGISKTEYNSVAAVTEFKYGMEISQGIRGKNPLKWFKSFGESWGMLPNNDALVFIDNHDNQRGYESGPVINYKQSKLYKMAIAFMLAHPYGNPQIISSFAFDHSDQGPPADDQGNIISPTIHEDKSCGNGWICEHRWRQIYKMVHFRNSVINTDITNWWDNGHNQIAFSRGNKGFIAINADNIDLKQKIQTNLPAGKYCDIISGENINDHCSGKTVIVDEHGYANIEILLEQEDGVLAIYID
ncbi:alpha-amylase 2-like [Chelonus insularis]|uniref:alpha-amylase 2-like n=1 Tax=Chelonus insularis TaxID=460826 RepID=UPI00158D98A0|nr:alpha-amylase 2-like [Chelonus insularis]